ncbi:ComF family protein [Chitinimonas lacunae]|uniref:ComF family protein n=1 Tax=Chitinimonas lacunae TaxID=1963018 RepID=A0ABV8MM27_9NEIS
MGFGLTLQGNGLRRDRLVHAGLFHDVDCFKVARLFRWTLPLSNFPSLIFNHCLNIAQRAFDLLLPAQCVLCGSAADRHGLCPGCRHDLPRADGPRCRLCAVALGSGDCCGDCLHHAPGFDHCLAACRYDWPLDALIPAFKYGGDLSLARPLASLLAERVAQAERPDLLLALPLHPQRQRQRGFNQSLLLARLVGARLGLPLDRRVLLRQRPTPPQASQSRAERRRAMRNAFTARRRLDGLHVVVVDDVMTSGASLDAAARALKAAGARRVDGWVVARADRL